ncbi:MAG: hypothetical protein SGILL_004475 [Bacillariaceae sp.]
MAVPILLSPTAADSAAVKNDSASNAATYTQPAHQQTTSVINEESVFWMSLSSDERYLLPKLEQLMEELQYSTRQVKSFRISNTQDISNLTSNRPLHKLKQVFQCLSQRQSSATCRTELFIKMSLQTESFQNLLESALESGAFSRLVVKGDYWTVAMEEKTMECITRALKKGNLQQVQFVGMYMPLDATEVLQDCLQCSGMDAAASGISLQFCRIHFEDASPLMDGLAAGKLPIHSLSVVECHWDDAKAGLLVRALTKRLDSSDTLLARLSLAGNSLGAVTLNGIAEHLQHPACKLQHLNLSRQTSVDMADLICGNDSILLKALSTNQSLKSLHLTDLALLGRHVQAMFDNINSHVCGNDSRIQDLNLANNLIESMADVWHASSKQQRNTSLKSLDLSGNAFWKNTTSVKSPCEERDVLSDMTHCFPHLHYLGKEVELGVEMEQGRNSGCDDISSQYWAQLQYNLDMNRAGRCLFTASLPLSLVPIALERANKVLVAAPHNDTGSDVVPYENSDAAPSGRQYFGCQPNSTTACSSSSSPGHVRMMSRSASAVYGMIQGLIAEHMGSSGVR